MRADRMLTLPDCGVLAHDGECDGMKRGRGEEEGEDKSRLDRYVREGEYKRASLWEVDGGGPSGGLCWR